MRRRYLIQKNAPNDFSRLSGLESVNMVGGSGCIITRYLSTGKGIPIRKYAYGLYNLKHATLPKNVYVSTSCGVENCVNPTHLIATYRPKSDEIEYIAVYRRTLDIDQLAHVLHVPASLLQSYIDTSSISRA